MALKIHQTFIVSSFHSKERLDAALTKLMPDYSRTQIQKWIENGEVLLNAKLVKTKTKITDGDIITVDATLEEVTSWQPQALPLDIVFEDEFYLIINKPPGLVVHPGAGNFDHTLLNALLYYEPSLKNLPRAGILHRLDKETSGLLVIAKNPVAFKNIGLQLRKRTLIRQYQTVVWGKLLSGGSINAPIARHFKHRKQMCVTDIGREAITHYRILEKYRFHTHLDVRLETGRTHQIRVHMQHIQHPVVGDPLYGSRIRSLKVMTPELIDVLKNFKRQALHAYSLEFSHPATHEKVHYKIPLPEDMENLLQTLKTDLKSSTS